MPLYDYHCNARGQAFELLVRSSSVPACPHCASVDLAKQISKPAPPGQTAGIIARGRAAAAKEGHFSNYSKAERQSAKIK